MAYIGPEPNPGQNREVDDISSGFNGSEVNFTLQVNSQNVSPGSSNAIIVSLGGVVQNPGTDYTVAASTLTFTTAPANGLSFFGLVLGQQVDTEGTADGSIVNSHVSGGAAIAGTKISPDFGSQNIVTTGNISGAAGTFTGDVSISDKIVHTGDTDTAIRFSGADTITTETGGSTRTTINSTGLSVTGAVYSSTGVVGEDAANHFDFVTDNRIAVSINSSEEFRFESDGDFHADGDVIAQSTTISSDEKLKENIKVVSDALDKVEALRGVTFDWKRDGKSSAGVIAQDVMGVLPEAVKEVQGLNDKESYLSVNYNALTSILIEAIKDLSAKIKVLEAK